MGCVKFLTNNYADSLRYANLFESSEQANFPASNVLARIRRSKVWRSGGYWNVTSSNNTLIFRDASGGSDKTATIAEGEYVSTTTFLAAVDAALEAAGLASYTVSINSNYKIVIASDLSGGATHFELRFAHASNTCESLLGFDSASYTGASSYTADFLRINTEEFLTFDLGLATSINAFALVGPRNQPIKLSRSGTFTLQGNMTNEWSAPLYSQAITYDDEAFVVLDDASFYTDPLRFWRIKFSDQNPNGYIEVGSVFLGTHFSPSRGGVQFPFSSQQDDRSVVIVSEGGQSLSDIKPKTRTFSATWLGLKKEDMEEVLSIYEEYGKHYPFFMVFDEEAAFHTSQNRSVKCVKFLDDPSFELVSFNNYKLTTRFIEEI